MERCAQSPYGNHRFTADGQTACRYCGKQYMDMHAESLKRKKWILHKPEQNSELVRTGSVTVVPSGDDWEHDDESEWHIARRVWTCSMCEQPIAMATPYWLFRTADEDGETTSTYCARCAIVEFEATED